MREPENRPRTIQPSYLEDAIENSRMAVLNHLALLDTAPETSFDNIIALAQMLAATPMALVSLVDSERQWFKARIGLDISETLRDVAFCNHAIQGDGVTWVADAQVDPRFSENILVIGPPNIRFYAGAPMVVRGQKIGTVCVLDTGPRPFDPLLEAALAMLAAQAANLCECRLAIAEANDARREASKASESKSRFLTNISHELRTPLNGVVGVASVLEGSELSPSQREMVAIIQKSGETLAALLDDVLDISKIEAGKCELQFSAFRLGEIVQQSVDLFRHRAEDKGLVLRLTGLTGKTYLGDGARIRQIVTNLVSNAVKFTESGSVEVEILATAAEDGDLLHIGVKDTGPGFTPEIADRLFHRFEQGDDSLTRRYGGTGLGLAISRSLAELMGGTLSASSTPGEGSCFTLTIDLQDAGIVLAEPMNTAAPEMLPVGRVLVADDNETNRTVLELMLKATGFGVTLVEDGLKAVEAFSAEAFDFVLMDVQMPVMDGLEAIRRIRALEQSQGRPRTPINTLSAHAMTEHVAQALAAGADDHLTKPITSQRLVGALSAALEAKDASVGELELQKTGSGE